MPVDRFYLDSPLESEKEYILTEKEHHHLAHVTRKKVGETIELVNGKGALAEARIEEIRKSGSTLSIESIKNEPPPSYEIILAQSIPRLNRLDTIVEKGTELGMTKLWLFPGVLSEKKSINPHQLERLKSQAVAAMKQSGRLFLPEISLKPPLSEWETLPFPSYFGDLDKEAPSLIKVWKPSEKILIFIGPEMGFDEIEVKKLRSLQSQGIKLHPNILRTDTAAIASLALISHFLFSKN